MATDIVWTDVLDVPGAVGDNFSNATIGWQTMCLVVSNTNLDPDVFGGDTSPVYKLARCLYACHMTALAMRGINGPTTSQSEGGVSTTNAYMPYNLNRLLATSYGTLLLSLMDSSYGGAMVL